MKVENFIYRVSSRARFNIALMNLQFYRYDGNGIINFSGMMISLDSNTVNLRSCAVGNEGKVISRLLLLISSIEIEHIAFISLEQMPQQDQRQYLGKPCGW